MFKRSSLRAAVSAAVLASMLAGCAGSGTRTASASGFGGRSDGEIGLATRALVALNANDPATAITLAERAVEKTPDDAGFRALLGNAYFAGGRFWSAESAYKDALSIYSNQPQAILKLALVEIALGKPNEALKFLEAGRSVLDPADYGLALALSGHAADAVDVLQTSARANGADARVRQNLALAYALSGDWTQARVIAAQDVPADQVDARIQQWAKLAKPQRASDQVASLAGVTPVASDQGQPIKLALRGDDTRLAASAPAPAPVVETAPVAVAAAPLLTAPPPPPFAPSVAELAPSAAPVPQFLEPMVGSAPVSVADAPLIAAPPAIVEAVAPAPPPVDVARVAAFASNATEALIAAAQSVVPEAVRKFIAPRAKPRPVLAAAPKQRAPLRLAALRRGGGNSVVQLGSYRSPQAVSAAWQTMTKRYPALHAYLPMRARFVSSNGTFWRLSITGFDSRSEASARCQLLQQRGGKCFVRGLAGDAPVEIASR